MVISFILGSIIFQMLLLPMVNNVVGDRLGAVSLEQGYAMVAICLGIAVAIVFIAAAIPAMRLIMLKLNEAIKGKSSENADRNGVRNTLIITQFVLGVAFLCMAFILNKQINFMKNASLGFNTEDVMVGTLDLGFENPERANNRFEIILQSLEADPYVKAVSTTREIPTAYRNNYNLFVDLENDKEVRMQFTDTALDLSKHTKSPW